jgi:putative restriction endonuclease
MFALGITDLRWHEQLVYEQPRDHVNFWTPTPWNVRLPPGSRWFFMLKSPIRKIGGFGTLHAYEEGTAREAWLRFGRANGVSSAHELKERVGAYARKRSKSGALSDAKIGFVILKDCVFLPPGMQFDPSELGLSFSRQIVKFKTFQGSLTLPYEAELPDPESPFSLVTEGSGDRALRSSKLRLGQALFRERVLSAYGDICAFTGTQCREALEAAHIQPFISLASNHVQNGLALRKDVHALFDIGLLSVDANGNVAVSEYLFGTEYGALHEQPIHLPARVSERPSRVALQAHFTGTFRASHQNNALR